MREMKEGARKTIAFSFVISLFLSYVAVAALFVFEIGGDLPKALQAPNTLYEFAINAKGELRTVLLIVPLAILGGLLYWQRSSLIQEKYEDASDYAVHGGSKFDNLRKLINGKSFSKNNKIKANPLKTLKMEKGIVLGKVPKKKELVVMPENTDIDNCNVLVIGSPGSGKGQAFVYPNLINNVNETIICCDPKGELYRDTHQIKRDQGYRVYLVDFVDFENCHRYNPIDSVVEDSDARAVANVIAKNATDGKRDFWTESALNFLSAIILYVKEENKNKANMTHVIDFAVRAGREGEYLDEIIDGLNEEHPAYNLFKLASISAGNTKSGIMATMAQQIGIFALRKVARLTETSDFLFEDLQKEKSIVYVKIPMDENPFVQLTAMFFDQLIEVFYKIAVRSSDNKVPIRSIFLFDEFSNIGTIEKYPKVLATCRGLSMVMLTVVQDFGQLEDKNRYGAEMTRSIINNHDSILFLRTKDKKTAEYLSAIADDTTAKIKTNSIQKKNGSKSTSEQYVKRRLIPVGDLISIKKNDCYLFVSGYNPVKLEKAWQFKVYKDYMKNYEVKYRPKLLAQELTYEETEQVMTLQDDFSVFAVADQSYIRHKPVEVDTEESTTGESEAEERPTSEDAATSENTKTRDEKVKDFESQLADLPTL